MIKTKKLILLVLICLGVAMAFDMNNSVTYADINSSSSSQTTQAKEESKQPKNNSKNNTKGISSQNNIIIKNFPGIVTVITFGVTLSYYLYQTVALNENERKLLSLKDGFLNYLSLPALLIGEIFLWIYTLPNNIDYNDAILAIILISELIIVCCLYLYVISHKPYTTKIIINYKDYEFIHRIDNNRFSAKLLNSKDDTKTYFFPISVLDNNFLISTPNQPNQNEKRIIKTWAFISIILLFFGLFQLFVSLLCAFIITIFAALVCLYLLNKSSKNKDKGD